MVDLLQGVGIETARIAARAPSAVESVLDMSHGAVRARIEAAVERLVVEILALLATMPGPLLIAIIGPAGAAKSTAAEMLRNLLAAIDISCVVHGYDSRLRRRWERPDDTTSGKYDRAAYANDIDQLMAGRPVALRPYSQDLHDYLPEVVLEPARVIVAEGIEVLHLPSIQQRAALTIAVVAPLELRIVGQLLRGFPAGRFGDMALDEARDSLIKKALVEDPGIELQLPLCRYELDSSSGVLEDRGTPRVRTTVAAGRESES